jgi:hypothetical protein
MKTQTIAVVLSLLIPATPTTHGQAARSQPAPSQPARRASGVVTVRQQFQGTTEMRSGDRAQPVRVDIRLWSLAGAQRIDTLDLPFRGLLVVELRAGRIATIIGGRRVERREGEIWSVPAGTTMQLETGDNMATLQTTLIAD